MPSNVINFTLNGRPVSADVQTQHNLVELLQRFGLFGARESCGQGLCGCCTVHVDGVAVSGCLYLAVMADNKSITTVESLDADGQLTPLQQAFIDNGAFQCGFCTSGFIMMAKELLAKNPEPTEEEIKDYLIGNLCRCGTYPEVIAAIKQASAQLAPQRA
jgi:aerobic-type carbon monoxide dehydrogenase small subunit (CoxS/CutS family)